MTCMFFNAHFKISVKLMISISIYISLKEKLLCSGIFVLTKAKKKKKKSFKFMLTYKALVPMYLLMTSLIPGSRVVIMLSMEL